MPQGTITSLGIGSSLDIQGILDSLREADEATITAKETKVTDYQATQDEFNVLNSLLLDMKSNASSLYLSSNFLTRNVSVSSEILSVTASDGAETGSYAVDVERLATESSYISDGLATDTDTVYVPTSQKSLTGIADTDIILAEGDEMTIEYGSGDDLQTITITGGVGGYTLSDLETAINTDAANDDGSGGTYVTASVYTDDDGLYHIEVAATSGGTGEANRVMITEEPDDASFDADDATFSYKVGDTEVSLSITADTTLADLATKINDDSDNPGVTATVVDTGYGDNPYQLVLKSDGTGEDNRITITNSLVDLTMTEQNGAGFTMTSEDSLSFDTPLVIRQADNNTDIVFQEEDANGNVTSLTAVMADFGVYDDGEELAAAVETALEEASAASGNGADYQVSWNSGTNKLEISEAGALSSVTFNWSDAGSTAAADLGFTADQTITPQSSSLNALVSVDGISYQRQSNTGVSDLVTGLSMSFTQTGTSNVTVSQETDSIKESITSIVSLFNDLIAEIDANDDYDEDTETWGTLAKYSSVDSMMSGLLSVFQTEVDTGGSITTIFDLGFEINQDGTVSIDETTLDTALSSNFDDLQAFFIGDDTTEGMGDLMNDHLRDLTMFGGYIESETGAIDEKIANLEETIEEETERLEKKYETLTAQFVEMDSYMREMESMQSYVSEIFSATAKDDD